MDYYIIVDNKTAGPYALTDFSEINLSAMTLVWNNSLPSWTTASDLPELQQYIIPPVPKVTPYNYPYNVQAVRMDSRITKSHGKEPYSWMIESIMVTMFLGVPALFIFPLAISLIFGILAIVNGNFVSTMFRLGHVAIAEEYSRQARNYMLASLISGIIIVIIAVILLLAFMGLMTDILLTESIF